MAEVEAQRARQIEEVTKLPHATHANAPDVKEEVKQPQAAQAQTDALKQPEAAQPKAQAAKSDKPKRLPAHPLKKETHQIVDRAQSVRIHAGKHFRSMRDTFIAQAEAQGSKNPVGQVYRNFVGRQKQIDRAEHRLLDKAFKRHGIVRAPSQTQEQSGPNM